MVGAQEVHLLQRYFDYPARAALNAGLQGAPIGAAFKLMEKVSQTCVARTQTNTDQAKSSEVLVDLREGKAGDKGIEDVIAGAKRVVPRRLITDPVSQFSDKNANYLLCCDTGMRSKVACMAMRNNGFHNVQYLALKPLANAHTAEIRSVTSELDSKNSFLPFAVEAALKM